MHAWQGGVFMKLDNARQEILFEVRPEVFKPMVAGAMRWSWVDIEAIDREELAELVREAWTMVVPRKMSRAHAPSP